MTYVRHQGTIVMFAASDRSLVACGERRSSVGGVFISEQKLHSFEGRFLWGLAGVVKWAPEAPEAGLPTWDAKQIVPVILDEFRHERIDQEQGDLLGHELARSLRSVLECLPSSGWPTQDRDSDGIFCEVAYFGADEDRLVRGVAASVLYTRTSQSFSLSHTARVLSSYESAGDRLLVLGQPSIVSQIASGDYRLMRPYQHDESVQLLAGLTTREDLPSEVSVMAATRRLIEIVNDVCPEIGPPEDCYSLHFDGSISAW
jgi:uncharacterized protein (DUF2267 family)